MATEGSSTAKEPISFYLVTHDKSHEQNTTETFKRHPLFDTQATEGRRSAKNKLFTYEPMKIIHR